ncbi:MAG: twin-arginine translocation signal domain-containing protein, partial [Phycisphaerae bacterium]|nr:twin-arginine translocation signal domain-containing protein [Phycisphaerae bacterium]
MAVRRRAQAYLWRCSMSIDRRSFLKVSAAAMGAGFVG